jgi:hypothetical protein
MWVGNFSIGSKSYTNPKNQKRPNLPIRGMVKERGNSPGQHRTSLPHACMYEHIGCTLVPTCYKHHVLTLHLFLYLVDQACTYVFLFEMESSAPISASIDAHSHM